MAFVHEVYNISKPSKITLQWQGDGNPDHPHELIAVRLESEGINHNLIVYTQDEYALDKGWRREEAILDEHNW